jgi:hypothetical protein
MILRHLWANLADQSPSMTELQLMREIAAIEQIHAAAFGPGEDKAADQFKAYEIVYRQRRRGRP